MSTAVQDIRDRFAQAPDNQATEIERVFALQQKRALTLRTSTAAERIAKIKRLKQALLDRTEEIHEACYKDFRKPPAEVDMTEIMPVVMEANDAIRHTKRWMKPMKVPTTLAMLGTKAHVRYEPKGVSLIVSPWNYPVNLTFSPLVSALAAGNTAILKPSEMTPHCSQLMEDMVREVFDESEIAVFQGAVETSQNLLDKPFDHIFFTGSPAVGKIIMGAAAKHLTSVTLELGGKSPVIVDKSADLDKAARAVAWGKFFNNGQTCIAPDLTYVHADVKDEFVEAIKQRLETMYGSLESIESNADYARIVNNKHYKRIKHLLDDAQSRGAKVLAGGQHDDAQDFLAPTLLTDIEPDAEIMQEEIFGPLMPIMTFKDTREVIDDINSRPKPLALYVFGKDNAFVDRVIGGTSAGGTAINTVMMQYLHGNLPFGGVNNSGIGMAHGHWGFKSFSHERGIVRDRFSSTHLMHPPYTPFTRKLINWTIKYFV
ncbi:aldehyde dehydrogenase family protein [Spectribacter hydrogenoxidans]|uniref:Aldehyde dehydrogenase n=1 Tax=Spectribacter hydrogenoxidans TaxID=3075608 RepID=A0ABU3BZ34_9GAMM|nr:aldehyde dehydrogenase family protein [Salinisphaera sp. W335]MDT0634558.1 aldehyde dehydrogenase family protein [Salinisphaera sp. W335]